MSLVIERGATRIALRVSRGRNRQLLADLFSGHDIVDITDAVPEDTDLCIVDEAGFTRVSDALAAWKRHQHPSYAPVLLLVESGDGNPWERYEDVMGDRIDAVQPIPVPRSAILARIESLLETRQYSKELTSERQLVERIFDTSPVAKTVLDTGGTIVRANQRAEDVLGLSKSDLSGRTYDAPEWKIIDEDGDPIPSEDLPLARVMDSGDPVYGYEHGIEHPDGERVWLSISMGPIRDDDGEIEYLVSAIEDITERERLERELRESEELQRAILSNITDTVFITDDEGRFTYVCSNVHHIFDHTVDEVQEMGTIEALLGDDPAPDGFSDGDVVENIDYEVTDADGDEHGVLVTVKSVSIQGGTRLYSVRDVTELVESERELELERERLETVVSNAPLILAAIDSDGTVTLSRGRQLEHLGLEPDGMTGESIFEVFDHIPEIRESAEQVLDGETFSTEIRIQDRVFESWNQPIYEDGDVDHAIIVAQDITERKHQEERFQAFVEGSSDVITVLDRDGHVEYVSPAIERILGYEPEVLNGENAFDLIHSEDRDRLVTELATLFESEPGTTVTEQHRIRHADGSWRWAESRASRESTLAPGQVIINTRDITDRIEREQELNRIFDRVTDAFAAVDAKWRFTYVNERAEELIDATEEGLLGQTHWEAFPEMVGTTFEEEYRRAMETQEPVFFEEYYPPLDTWFAVRAYPSESGLSIYFRDISERKERDRLLRRTQRAIEASGHAVYITDPDGTIQYVNPAFERITGYDSNEVIGENPRILNSGEMPDSHYEELWTTITAGEIWEEEIINQRKDDSRYYAAQTIAPITDENADIEGFVAIQTDITDHKDRLQQLQVMDRVLRHNLANEMNLIRGHAELIQEQGSEPLASRGEAIVQYSDRLLDLAEKQRNITKVLSADARLESLDCVSVIQRTVESLASRHPDAQIELDLPEHATVLATKRFSRAIEEVVENAIEHTDQEPPEVEILVVEDDETVQIQVTDTGPGIPEMERDIVMGEHEVEPLYHGSGLGLWLVSWIVKRSNGRLSFEENKPRGSIVTITLQNAPGSDDGSSTRPGGNRDGE